MAGIIAPDIVTNGLILYLDASNTKSYPGTNTTWRDLTGSTITGSLVNGPTFSSTNSGVITFDGTNDYVQVSDNANLRSSSGTYSIWFNCTGTASGSSTNSAVLYKADTVGSFNGYIILARTTQVVVSVKTADTGYTLGGYSATGWVNATLVNSAGTSFSVYINGVLRGTQATAAVTISSEPMRIGIGLDSFWANFQGNVPIVSIYNRALTDNEVLQNYNATKTRFGL